MSATDGVAAAIVDRWAGFYTRGLPDTMASDRREELAADLVDHGQEARDRGVRPAMVTAEILLRAIKGAPADIAWRRAQLRATDPASARTRFFGGGLLLAGSLLSVLLVTIAIAAVARDGDGIIEGDPSAILTFVAALSIACGMVLLFRHRTRWLGALWIAAGAPVVTTVGLDLLAQSSTLLLYVSRSTSTWVVSQSTVAIGLATFFLAMAAWWVPVTVKRAAP